jgi:hypothetical protein
MRLSVKDFNTGGGELVMGNQKTLTFGIPELIEQFMLLAEWNKRNAGSDDIAIINQIQSNVHTLNEFFNNGRGIGE